MGCRHPVQRRLHAAAIPCVAAAGSGVVLTPELDDFAFLVLHDLSTPNEICAAEAHLAAGSQPIELLRRVLHEIVALDEQLSREWHLARTGRWVLRIVDDVELLRAAFG